MTGDGVSGWTDVDPLPPEVEALRTQALEALDDDLDTVRMIAALDEPGRPAVPGRVRSAGRPGTVGARPAAHVGAMTDEPPVPLSVQLGEVVPPEDPEDWRKPLTWIMAVGMLAAPLWAAVWFVLAPPSDPYAVPAGVMALAVMVASGAVLVGASQRGALRALLGTLGAGLFAALGVVVVGSALASSTALGTAVVAAASGMIGVFPAAAIGGALSDARQGRRLASPIVAGGLTALIAVEVLLSL